MSGYRGSWAGFAALAFFWASPLLAAIPRTYTLPGVVTGVSARSITVRSDETDDLVTLERPHAVRAPEGMEVGAHVTLRYTKDRNGRHLVRDIGAPAPEAGTWKDGPAPAKEAPGNPVFEPMAPAHPIEDDRLHFDSRRAPHPGFPQWEQTSSG